ncbi:MAG: tetratricopeptide repeat protein [Isosphaerales bacterium]
MPRRDVGLKGIVLAGMAMVLAGAIGPVRAGEDPRTALSFVQELKAWGLHDLALEYIVQLRGDAAQPESVKAVLDYEESRILIDEAARSGDLVRREDLLKEARDKLEGFVKANPQLRQARDAHVQMGKLLLERGHTAMLIRDDTPDPAKKQAKVAEARAAFTEAHASYAKVIEPLQTAHKKLVGYMDKTDPRVAERDSIYATLLDALLQQGVADYELAATFPAGSAERAKSLKEALDQFDYVHKNHREQWAGLAARMWQAKCYEEQGEIGSAIAIYKELMGHTEPRLRELQRHVGYFYIVALGRRKQYALAADEASRWLATYNRGDERRSAAGLGVQLELAKNIDAQMPEIKAANERSRAIGQIVEATSQVVRSVSPYKKDALELLKKYRPSSAMRAEEVSRLSYEDAVGKAEDAIGSHEWERAIVLLQAAVRKADLTRDIDKANHARYELAFCYFTTKRYYEADVLAEHLARRYPQGGLSPRASEIAMQSLAEAYTNYVEVDRLSDLDRLVKLASYTADAWPDREEGDDARMNLGQIYLGMGQYDKAIAALSAVRRRSRQWVAAQNRLGAAHWAKSRDLERRGDATGAGRDAQRAIELLNTALKARREAGTGPSDPGLVDNIGDLATVLSETGKPADALALLDPVIKGQTVKSGPGYSRLMEAQLKAYIASGKIEPAIASMKGLEQAGGAAGRAQLYYRLGKLIEKELDRLREKGNTAALTSMHHAYKAFLTTLVESKTGQTYESLLWAGRALLNLDAYEEAEKVFRRVLTDYTQDPQFLQQAGGPARLLLIRLGLAASLRGQNRFDDADTLIDDILKDKQYKGYIEPQFEKGLLLEARAQAGNGSWTTALSYWENLAKRLGGARTRSAFYYDSWYHVAWVLSKQKSKTKARQALLGVMRLSPSVGGSEMKAKYQGLLARIQ